MDDATRRFVRRWWSLNETTFVPNRWLGLPCWQNPCDAWIVQEIIEETRPDLIVETGTLAGGSAALWASLLALFGDGRVVSIDEKPDLHELALELPIVKERVEFIAGSSTDPALVERIGSAAAGERRHGNPRQQSRGRSCPRRARRMGVSRLARLLPARRGRLCDLRRGSLRPRPVGGGPRLAAVTSGVRGRPEPRENAVHVLPVRFPTPPLKEPAPATRPPQAFTRCCNGPPRRGDSGERRKEPEIVGVEVRQPERIGVERRGSTLNCQPVPVDAHRSDCITE